MRPAMVTRVREGRVTLVPAAVVTLAREALAMLARAAALTLVPEALPMLAPEVWGVFHQIVGKETSDLVN
jgi:hypothetical protein